MIVQEEKGLKYDNDKLRYDLTQYDAMKGLIEILTFGATKYADRNWEKGIKWSRIIASLKRHLAAIERGEDYDPESGKLHADHVQCNAHFLAAYFRTFPQGDDRPHKFLKPSKIGLDIDGVLADFTGHITKLIGREGHQPTHWNDPMIRDAFPTVKDDPEFWINIPILTKPVDIPFEPHCYITARSIDCSVTQNWLNINGFPKAPLYCVGVDQSKVEAAKKSGVEIFVDDNFDNFVELTNNGIFTYLFDASHNRKHDVGHRRVKSLYEIK